MGLSQRTLSFALIGAAAYLAWNTFSYGAQEAAMLRTSTVKHQDYYATLWFVEGNGFFWIRAENPKSRWLRAVRENPDVSLRRGPFDNHYRATVWDGKPELQREVNAMFRAKYGLADQFWGFFTERSTIPIRLVPR